MMKVSEGSPHIQTIDARGKHCPLPLLYLHRALEQWKMAPKATEMILLSTDESTASELSAYCQQKTLSVAKQEKFKDEKSVYWAFHFFLNAEIGFEEPS